MAYVTAVMAEGPARSEMQARVWRIRQLSRAGRIVNEFNGVGSIAAGERRLGVQEVA